MFDYDVLSLEEIKENYCFETDLVSPYCAGIPLFEISNKTIEEIYYFRWHTFCKHIKKVDDGYVVTEFLPPVHWAGKNNTICCAAAHHIYEGRWLYNKEYISSYSRFWFSQGAEPRKYSFWVADALYSAACVSGDFSAFEELYEKLKQNFFLWEEEKGLENGMYYQIDDRDGMEYSISGNGIRPTINSYMYGDALALSTIAKRLKKREDEELFSKKANQIKEKINKVLWDNEAQFYKTVNAENGKFACVRELIGYIPWYFNIPESSKSVAWKFLNSPQHFFAPYGITTAEQNHPDFMKRFDHECLWNGPVWPFATSQTLTALGNLICNYEQDVMKKSDYFKLLCQYANSHYIEENGERMPFIDENLDPFNGEWIARNTLRKMFKEGFQRERGRDYNHSTFCDLVLSGLVGIRSSDQNKLVVNPLFESDDIAWMCADGVCYHNNKVCVLWDKNGTKYKKGKGFTVFLNGEKIFESPNPCRFECVLEEAK